MKKTTLFITATLASCLWLTACKPAEKISSTELIRPVKTVTVGANSSQLGQSFSAEIKPRIDSPLAFRVSGKVIERSVELGQTVKKGQVLMRLDPTDLQLASSASAASVASAKANADVAEAALKRSQELARQNFISAGALDQALGLATSARAALKAAEANAAIGLNATEYGVLKADSDGVVTALLAEVGQVTSAGSPVLRLAAGKEKDVVFSIPESQLATLKRGNQITVQLWSDPTRSLAATVRDVASVSDPLSRSFAVKAQLQEGANVPLGATATVIVTTPSNGLAKGKPLAPVDVMLPLAALIESQGQPAVWLVEGGLVKKQPVALAMPRSTTSQLIAVRSGLNPGAVVVVAGTHVLTEGQKVKLLSDASATNPASNPASVVAAPVKP
jgi:RND family efflux transporter MFP subunit